MSDQLLIMSNVDVNDNTFESDVGTWNVTKARKDCTEGRHRLYGFEVIELFNAIQNVEIDQEKVRTFASKKVLAKLPPAILIGEAGKIWVIEGHHTIHAHRRAGKNKMFGYVIEEKDAEPYRVYYNGERIAPWRREK